MFDKAHAARLAGEKFAYQTGRFYGSTKDLGLGVGLIYDGILFPVFDEVEKLFDTAVGLVYVLSHECDVDRNNIRFFNDYVLMCPIIELGAFVEEYSEENSNEKVEQIITDLSSDKIYRAIYVPPISGETLPLGGIIYFNQITNAHISSFSDLYAKPICALSSYAQRIIDYKLQNHLLRPKADILPVL
jgi:hypothetical protein